MYHFLSPETIQFPSVEEADAEGLLAIGGDLTPEWLLTAYPLGIFPWFNDGDPILWWSPPERLVLLPEELYIAKTMRQTLRRNTFTITVNTQFERVIRACAETPRSQQDGTWITAEMIHAYLHLHQLGYAHSVEVWHEGYLVGGLYGIIMGTVFFGESMFAKMTNASKAGFITWVKYLQTKGFTLIDCQTETTHLQSLGAKLIPRKDFLLLLQNNTNDPFLPDTTIQLQT